MTGRPALKDKEYAALKWATRHGTGWAASPTPPIIINGKIYIGVGNKICRLNKDTGKVEAESEAMPGKVGYAMNPFLYAEGKIFAQIEQGQVCAVNIENLVTVISTPTSFFPEVRNTTYKESPFIE